MRVVKVKLAALTTSFRYPFFVVGRQPTYEMPPPATIYGHICSAAGELLDPSGISFAYHFAHEGKATDLEHAHMLGAAGGKMERPGRGADLPKVMQGGVTPLLREFFFLPSLTLYVHPPDLEAHFRRPRYPVVLGRSQDLAGYLSVETIELERRERAYFEGTLLPVTLQSAGRGVGITMPRLLDLQHNRAPTFGQYVMVTGRIEADGARALSEDGWHWVDPQSRVVDGAHRGLVFLTLTDDA